MSHHQSHWSVVVLETVWAGQVDLAESDENGNENENWNEKGNGRQPYFMRMRMAYYRAIL